MLALPLYPCYGIAANKSAITCTAPILPATFT